MRKNKYESAKLMVGHTEALIAMGATSDDPYSALLRIERKANRFMERCCNEAVPEDEQNQFDEWINKSVAKVFGGKLPDGFFINGDPRGFTLKIKDDLMRDSTQPCYKLHRDWGGYGILAPDIDSIAR